MKQYHFIAIGGAAMHNLAIALHKNGFHITGSDDQIFDPSRSNLLKYGLLPEKEGWFPEKISSSLEAVILGMHARSDNPELLRAKELGMRIYSFPEFIYEHSKNKTRIVIGGSHGKTTITGMILHVLNACGIETDFLLGASVHGIEGNVRLSETAPLMVIEGDEYLTSPIDPRPKFHLYRPHIAVISGIAWDHINVFRTFSDYRKQFEIFSDLIEPNGELIFCADDPEVVSVAGRCRNDIRATAYSLPEHEVKNGVTYLHCADGNIQLEVFGNHNLLNIEAARQVCLRAGVKDKDFYNSISTWKGAYNRLTTLYQDDHLVIFRDFAHAPSKVSATVESVRKQYADFHFIACLELHTFSSLSKEFLPHYEGSMDLCDLPVIFFNPHALEMKKLESLKTSDIMNGFKNMNALILKDISDLKTAVRNSLQDRTVILFMSSGNFNDLDLLFLL